MKKFLFLAIGVLVIAIPNLVSAKTEAECKQVYDSCMSTAETTAGIKICEDAQTECLSTATPANNTSGYKYKTNY